MIKRIIIMDPVRFAKMHGTGNDFVFIDAINQGHLLDDEFQTKEWSSYVRKLCDRHFGIGADGVILVCPSTLGASFRMRIYNADGSQEEMCGNGLRCAAKFVLDNSIVSAADKLTV